MLFIEKIEIITIYWEHYNYYNNKMNTLPNEIILLMFNKITLITDKRQFLRTCINYNKITKQSMKLYDKKYDALAEHLIHLIQSFEKRQFNIKPIKINKYRMEKFTLELCHDKYFDMIPKSYIVPNNRILVMALTKYYSIPKQIDNDNFFEYAFTIIKKSFMGNDIPILRMAKNNGCNLDNICRYAAVNGNLDVFGWAQENGCNMERICEFAANGGQLEMLKWARRVGKKWDENTCAGAAYNGHLEVLKWARENGCKWDARTTAYASANNQLNTLKWALENGCMLHPSTWDQASRNGHYNILKWAKDNGYL